jgi:glycosyltransferase involved in cell wall biosynthesis
MKIVLIHNAYRQRGGEDSVLEAEGRLLRAAGHTVIEYLRDNNAISGYGNLARAALAPRSIWAWDSCRELESLLKREKPDLAHFHNTFPLISPAAYYVCREAGIPVIQTLHNYRLLCPAATFFRGGHLCEACLGKGLPWNAVVHACYRKSHAASAAVVTLLGVHRALRTWKTKVNAFIAPSEFAKEKFAQGGLPASKIFVKPNFVFPGPCPNGRTNSTLQGDYAVFVGRLAEEKGLRTLLAAWRLLDGRIPLRIVGDGPLRKELAASTSKLTTVSLVGRVAQEKVFDMLKYARFLVFPSEWYEPFGCVITESFAFGVPVIASRLGAIQQIVKNNFTGLHFIPGDADDLAAKVEWAWTHPKEMAAMGRHARSEYETKYSAKRNYELLMDIYRHVLGGNPGCSIHTNHKKKESETSDLESLLTHH